MNTQIARDNQNLPQSSSENGGQRLKHVQIPRGPRTKGPGDDGRYGGFKYEWSTSRKRAFLEITNLFEALPQEALSESFDPLTSVALWDHADLRLIDPNIQVNIVGIATISEQT